MKQLAADGRAIGANVELTSAESAVITNAVARLRPLWPKMEKCLNAAFAKQRRGTGFGRAKYKYRQWYNENGASYAWCSSSVPEVDTLSAGSGATYAIWVRCGRGPKLPNGLF